MQDVKTIINDSELYQELVKAYWLAIPYRSKVQYKKDIICHTDTIIVPEAISNLTFGGCLISAYTGYVSNVFNV